MINMIRVLLCSFTVLCIALESSLLSVSNDILSETFEYLTTKEVSMCYGVSAGWRSLIEDKRRVSEIKQTTELIQKINQTNFALYYPLIEQKLSNKKFLSSTASIMMLRGILENKQFADVKYLTQITELITNHTIRFCFESREIPQISIAEPASSLILQIKYQDNTTSVYQQCNLVLKQMLKLYEFFSWIIWSQLRDFMLITSDWMLLNECDVSHFHKLWKHAMSLRFFCSNTNPIIQDVLLPNKIPFGKTWYEQRELIQCLKLVFQIKNPECISYAIGLFSNDFIDIITRLQK